MERFKTSKRLRPAGGDFAVIGLVALLAVVIWLLLMTGAPGNGKYLRIWQDGELIQEIPLSRTGGEQFIELEGRYHNTVVISGETAGFVDSDCPNQDCVDKGMLTRVGDTAVCLPNRTILEIVEHENEADIDAFAG